MDSEKSNPSQDQELYDSQNSDLQSEEVNDRVYREPAYVSLPDTWEITSTEILPIYDSYEDFTLLYQIETNQLIMTTVTVTRLDSNNDADGSIPGVVQLPLAVEDEIRINSLPPIIERWTYPNDVESSTSSDDTVILDVNRSTEVEPTSDNVPDFETDWGDVDDDLPHADVQPGTSEASSFSSDQISTYTVPMTNFGEIDSTSQPNHDNDVRMSLPVAESIPVECGSSNSKSEIFNLDKTD